MRDAYSVRYNLSRREVEKTALDVSEEVDAFSVGGEDMAADIWRTRASAWMEMLKVEVCVMRKSVSMCFWNLQQREK